MPEATKPRFKDSDLVRIKDDDVVGIVVGFGVSVGDGTPERITVKIGQDDVREVFAAACELAQAIDPKTVSAAAEEVSTLVSSSKGDVTIHPGGDTVRTSLDDELTESELEAMTRPAGGVSAN